MSVDLSGPGAVQARIMDIQSRFASLTAARPVMASATATPSPSFDDTLAAMSVDGGPAAVGTTSAVPTAIGTATGAVAGGLTGDQVVTDARRYLGVPYQWGGSDPATGLDCSGLVQRAYADLGVTLPRTSAEQARTGTPVASLADARPGDLVAFGSPVDHIGIYAGNGTMVVAPHTGDVVKVETITQTPTAIRRVVPPAAVVQPAGVVPPGSGALAGAPAAYQPLFAAAGARYGISPDLLAAVAHAESDFDPSSVSSAGAVGLMQIMPGTARDLGVDPRDPAQAVDGAARLLASNLHTFGSMPLALAAYNAGSGAVQRYGGIPPYPETQAYVARVLAYAKGTG